MIHDISRLLSPETAAYPGDDRLGITRMSSLEEDDIANLTSIRLSPHLGTHIDAPWHYSPDPTYPSDLPLEIFIGPAQLITIKRKQETIHLKDIRNVFRPGIHRLLLHTEHSLVPDEVWDDQYPGIDPEAINWLSDKGVLLLGTDTPSVDPADSTSLVAHHQALTGGIILLENLRFTDIPDGFYQLVALPLRLAGTCASPVRAILIEEQ